MNFLQGMNQAIRYIEGHLEEKVNLQDELQGPVNREMEIAWKRIFDEWLPSVNYKHAQTMEIECFPYEGRRDDPNFKFEIWVPIV